MPKDNNSPSIRIGGHVEIHIHIEPTRRRISDVIYEMTHKKRGKQKRVSVFVAGGSIVDKRLEQANKSVAKKKARV